MFNKSRQPTMNNRNIPTVALAIESANSELESTDSSADNIHICMWYGPLVTSTPAIYVLQIADYWLFHIKNNYELWKFDKYCLEKVKPNVFFLAWR